MTNWIKDRRQQLRISQDDLAARLQTHGIDITRGTISHWEMGRHNPPLDNPLFANALAEALNMSVTEVLMKAGYALSLEGYSDDARQAAAIVNRMPPRRQRLAVGILEKLLTNDD